MCYQQYPTIVNNIPQDKKIYNNSMDSFAEIDNALAKSQTDIGESSNLAQIAQTYDCTFREQKYADYTCILSVVAQIAIDNAKRKFDIDVGEEIKRIKKDMDIKANKYPAFWKLIKPDFKNANINHSLICPMNYLHDLQLCRFRHSSAPIPFSDFFVKHKLEKDRKQCKKVEELISKYSLKLYEYNTNSSDDYLLLRSDFDDLINDIKKTYLSSTYTGLISWLIDRAFMVTPDIRYNSSKIKSTINTNRPLLLKVLYDINPQSFKKCFKKCNFGPHPPLF